MAPDLLGPPSKKRRLSPDQLGASGSESSQTVSASSPLNPNKRRKLPPIARQHVHPGTAEILPVEVVEPLFDQSIALMLKSVGFDSGNRMALAQIRKQAEEFMTGFTKTAMRYAAVQRRTNPTITDFEEALRDRCTYTPTDLADEVDRYRQSAAKLKAPTTNGNGNAVTTNGLPKLKTHVYTLPPPPPEPPTIDEEQLAKLLGPELIKPRKKIKIPPRTRPAWYQKLEAEHEKNPAIATSKKPTIVLQPERPYMESFQPVLPSKHTYEAHYETIMPNRRDAKKIRELASEEARQSGETLRKLLAEFSKCAAARKHGIATGEVDGGVYRGGNARKERDDFFDKAWESLLKEQQGERAAEIQKKEDAKREKQEKRERERKAKSMVNGVFPGGYGGGFGSMMDLDESSSEDSDDEPEERVFKLRSEPEDDAYVKGLLDTIVNWESGKWAKGGLKRIPIR